MQALLSNDPEELAGALAPPVHLVYWAAIHIDRERPPSSLVLAGMVVQAVASAAAVAASAEHLLPQLFEAQRLVH